MKDIIKLHDRKFKIMIPAEKIDEAVSAVAQRINEDYGDKETPLFVGVLNGSFMFMAELMQRITLDCEASFVKIASYRGTASTGKVHELIGLSTDIRGRHVVIVEDIIDSGLTMQYLRQLFGARNPASITTISFLDKASRHPESYKTDMCGFEIPDEFVVGYGLDYAQKYRNMPYIGVLKPEVYSK